MIVGIIIGSGIFKSTPVIADNVTSTTWLLVAWLLGGALALLGAASYAELTTAYPRQGGDYVFLTRAYGRPVGLMFAWCELWIVRPGNLGALAYVYAEYANHLFPISPAQYGMIVHAIIAILVLTAINIEGVQLGKWTQNVLTFTKVLGLGIVVVVGLFLIEPAVTTPVAPVRQHPPDFRLAMILIMFSFGGWNEMSYVAAEVKNPRKNLLRALLIGTAVVTLVYVVVNAAFVRALGLDQFSRSHAVAADLMSLRYHQTGVRIISLLICLSCLGAINGMILTGARIYYALGTEHQLFSWLGKWSPRFGTPVRCLVVQSIVTIGLVIGFGLYENGFQRLVLFTSPLFWLFFLLVGVAIFVLRRTDPETPRPYRAIFYPLSPLVFCLSSLFMLYCSVMYAIENRSLEALWALVLLAAGLVVCWYDPGTDDGRKRGMGSGSSAN